MVAFGISLQGPHSSDILAPVPKNSSGKSAELSHLVPAARIHVTGTVWYYLSA